MKTRLKIIVQNILFLVGRHRWIYPKKQLLILMYHRVLPDKHPDINFIQPGMVVEPETFRMHLIELKKLFTIVHLDEWINNAKNGGKVPDKACAITFDDGWKDNYEYAFPVLQEEQVPATIYLVTDMIGTKNSFWPERLARLLYNDGHGHPASTYKMNEFKWIYDICSDFSEENILYSRTEIDNIIMKAKKYSDNDIITKLEKIEEAVGKKYYRACDILNWDELNDMVKSGLIKLGSHTKNHIRLTNDIDEANAKEEIIGSKSKLEGMLHVPIRTFCFPNGDYTLKTKKIVHDVYDAACTTKSGWNSSNSDLYELKRIGIHQDIALNRKAFLSRLSGWI